MNPMETAEIRRRLNPQKANPSAIYGLYVTDSGEVISEFRLSPAILPESVLEKYMAIFKKLLSGTPEANLRCVEFSSGEVMEGAHHPLLMNALNTALEDEEARIALLTRVQMCLQEEAAAQAQSVDKKQAAPNYLLLLLHDSYDKPSRRAPSDPDAEAGSVFHYIMCALCPVKQVSSGLSYAGENGFTVKDPEWIAAMPEVGFTFPALEEGGANIYRTLYYTRTPENTHPAFLLNVFGKQGEMSPQEMSETFNSVLAESLAQDCRLETMQAVHDTISAKVEEQKADRTAEPLRLSHQELKQVLADCGVDETRAQRFSERMEETFGEADIPAVNVIGSKQLKVEAPGVSIRVSPELSGTLQTRVIDGKPYILVPVDGDVEVNGVVVSGTAE